MHRLAGLLGIVLFLGACSAKGQLQEVWRATFPAYSMEHYVATPGGDLLFVGTQRIGPTNTLKLVRLGGAGKITWIMELGPWWAGSSPRLAVDAAENIYLATRPTNSLAYTLLKFSPSGQLLWQVPESFVAESAPTLVMDAEGNLCMAGLMLSDLQRKSFWFGAYDTNGTRLWRRYFTVGTNAATGLTGFVASGDGHWLFSGTDFKPPSPRTIVGRLSASGVLKWAQALEDLAPGFKFFRNIQAGENGSLYATGDHMVKVNADGTLAWAKTNRSSIVGIDRKNSRFFTGDSVWGGYPLYPGYPTLARWSAGGQLEWKTAMPQEPFLVVPNGPGKWLAGAVNDGHWSEPLRLVSFEDTGRQRWQVTVPNFYQSFGARPELMARSNGSFWLIGYPGAPGSSMTVAAFQEMEADGLPVIVEPPQSITARAGGQIELRVKATGTGPLTCWWRRQGDASFIRSGEALLLNNSTPANAGEYFVQVSNAVGVVYSQVVSVRVLRLFVSSPTFEMTTALNSEVILPSGVEGDGTLVYQWYHDGTILKDQTNALLRLPAIGMDQAGTYSVMVSNETGPITHLVAKVHVTGPVSQQWTYRAARDVCCTEVDLEPEAQGRVYLVAGGELKKFSSEGQLLWGASGNFRCMTLDGQGGAIVDGNGVTTRFSADGGMLWENWERSSTGLALWSGKPLGINKIIQVFDLQGNLQSELVPQLTNGTFGGAIKVLPTPDGGLMCSAMAYNVAGRSQIILTKWNQAGEQLWVTQPITLGEEENVASQDFVVGLEGSVLFSATIAKSGQPKRLTVRLDETGRKVWERRFDFWYDDWSVLVAVDHTGAGLVVSQGSFTKYDQLGNPLWEMPSGHAALGVRRPQVMRLDSAGNIYLVGQGADQQMLEKLDPEGNSVWRTSLPWSREYVQRSALELGTDGSIYAAASYNTNYCIAKFLDLENAQAPAIVSPPSPALAIRHPGESVTFTGAVTGAPPLEVRWKWGGSYISNATNTTLSLQNLGVNSGGYFSLEVSNAYGVACSRPARLSVGVPPQFELAAHIPPYGPIPAAEYLQVNEGETLRVHVVNTNSSQQNFWQWYLNGTAIPRAASSTLVLSNVSRSMGGTLSVRATNIFGTTEHSLRLYVETELKTVFEILEATNVWEALSPPALAVNKAGEVFLAGVINLAPLSLEPVRAWFLKKYSPVGKTLWQVTQHLAPGGFEGSPLLQLDTAGNVLVGTHGGADGSVWLTKVSTTGATLWQTRLQMAAGRYRDLTSLVLGADGGVYLAGFEATGLGELRIFVSKVIFTGKEAWTIYLPLGEPPGYVPLAAYLAPHPSGGVCLASPRGITRVIDSGAALWTVGTNFLQCATDPSGAIYGAGSHTARYASSGKRLWGSVRHGMDLHADEFGLVGFSYDYEWGRQLVTKNSLEGNPVWSTGAEGTVLITGPDGSIYITGSIHAPPAIRKLSAAGEERWKAKGRLLDEWECETAELALCENGDLVALHYLVNSSEFRAAYRLTRYQQSLPSPASYVRVTPSKVALQVGRPVTLTASPAGLTNYRLQWYKNNSVLLGQTNLTLRLAGFIEDEGFYQARLFTSTKVLSSVEVPVRVPFPSLRIDQSGLNGTPWLSLRSENDHYPAQLQSSTNLVQWTDVEVPYSGLFTNTPARFFRAIQHAP